MKQSAIKQGVLYCQESFTISENHITDGKTTTCMGCIVTIMFLGSLHSGETSGRHCEF